MVLRTRRKLLQQQQHCHCLFSIEDAVKIYRSFMKYFLSQINSHFHVVSGNVGIYIRQYVNSSLRVLTKMANIGT